MAKKKLKKGGSVPDVVIDVSKDFEVKNYDYEYLQGAKSDQFESDLNYLLNKSTLKSEVRIISESIEIVEDLEKPAKRRNKKVSVTDVTKDLDDITFSDSDEECEPKSVRIISESTEIIDNSNKPAKRKNKKKDVAKELDDSTFTDFEEFEAKQKNLKKKASKLDSEKKKNDKLKRQVENLSNGDSNSGSIKDDVSKGYCDKLQVNPDSSPNDSPDKQSNGKQSKRSKELRPANYNTPPIRMSPEKADKKSKNGRNRSKSESPESPSNGISNKSIESPHTPNSNENVNSKSELPSTPVTLEDVSFISNTDEDMNKFYDDLCEPEIEVEAKKKKKRSKKKKSPTPASSIDPQENGYKDTERNKENDEKDTNNREIEEVKKKKKSKKKKSATPAIVSSIDPQEDGDKDPECNKEDVLETAAIVSSVDTKENGDNNTDNKENVDISQNKQEGEPKGEISSLQTKERTDELKETPRQLPNPKQPESKEKPSVANLRSIFEHNNESPFQFNLKKTNSASKNQDKLPDVLPIKTIIGLSHLQILKLDLKDVKIKTLVGSSSLSKYANTGLTFTIKHTDDLFETEKEKVIFFQLCIYIALFEAIGYKKICQKHDNILELFGEYREINLETTRTKLTPSNKEIHQNNLDYSVLSYLGHILIWAANLQIKSGVETIYSIYNLDIDPDTVQDYVGGAHLWDRLNRERKSMSSKRWKHILKFRTAFPFEIDQFTLILRFMKVDVNNLINWN